MADAVAGKIQVLAEFYEQDDELTRSGALRHLIDLVVNCAAGTSDGQVDRIYSRRTTIAASATTVYDLAGSLADAVGGDTITMVDLCGIILVNHNTTAGDDLSMGPDATNGCPSFWVDASDRVRCEAGITNQPGFVVLYSPRGFAVGAGATDEIAVIETGGVNTVTYSIMFLGRSS